MEHRTWFVTGTDTAVGKTWGSLALMQSLQSSGYSVSGMKPVASGATLINGRWQNGDAILLGRQASTVWDYRLINPYVYVEPISPNFAAKRARIEVCIKVIVEAFCQLQSGSDVLVVEGIGGWRVPWGRDLEARNLVRELKIPVLMVVGLRLGCINHALMTIEAILHDRIEFAGWIAAPIDNGYLAADETLDYLADRLPAPMLGKMPRLDRLQIKTLARSLDVRSLLL